MKKFNLMSEKQMSDVNGGLIGLIVGLLCGLMAAVATGTTVELVKAK